MLLQNLHIFVGHGTTNYTFLQKTAVKNDGVFLLKPGQGYDSTHNCSWWSFEDMYWYMCCVSDVSRALVTFNPFSVSLVEFFLCFSGSGEACLWAQVCISFRKTVAVLCMSSAFLWALWPSATVHMPFCYMVWWNNLQTCILCLWQ